MESHISVFTNLQMKPASLEVITIIRMNCLQKCNTSVVVLWSKIIFIYMNILILRVIFWLTEKLSSRKWNSITPHRKEIIINEYGREDNFNAHKKKEEKEIENKIHDTRWLAVNDFGSRSRSSMHNFIQNIVEEHQPIWFERDILIDWSIIIWKLTFIIQNEHM